MAVEGASEAPRRGRPRSERSRQAILQAASELVLERELSAISMDAVAERAGASKATIYRWWPSKELLVVDAVLSEWATAAPEPAETGALVSDLRSLVVPWARELVSKPYGRVIASLLASVQSDPEFAREYITHFVGPRREQGRRVFERAIERGEIPAATDVDAALDLLYGPFYHRLLQGHAELSASFARTIVEYVAHAVTASGEQGR
jgi:AcrR family transcriptional regulator